MRRWNAAAEFQNNQVCSRACAILLRKKIGLRTRLSRLTFQILSREVNEFHNLECTSRQAAMRVNALPSKNSGLRKQTPGAARGPPRRRLRAPNGRAAAARVVRKPRGPRKRPRSPSVCERVSDSRPLRAAEPLAEPLSAVRQAARSQRCTHHEQFIAMHVPLDACFLNIF